MSNKLEVSLNAALNVPVIKVNGENISNALDGKADSFHTHVSSQITDLNALKIEIFKMIYPIGSIYITTTPIHNDVLGGEYLDYIYGEFNGCIFQLMPSNLFLKNVNYSINKVDHIFDGEREIFTEIIENDNVNDTGGNLTHTHTTGDHKLIEAEMPSHSHGAGLRIDKDVYSGYTPQTSYNTDCIGHGFAWDRAWISSSGVNIEPTGGNQPHNHGDTGSASNLPPYITMYMYKRIA